MFLHKPDMLSFIKFASLSLFSFSTTYYLANPRGKRILSAKNLIITTGCDSGLGYSIAVHCHEKLKASIVACVHKKNSRGAEKLQSKFGNSKRFHMCELDVTQDSSINELRRFVEELLEKTEELEFTALINNCGVMIFGEAEWQTNEMIENQINVNLMGTIKMTRAMLPLARKYKSRIINVSSHCALKSLPTLAVYGATKAGISSFTDALRLEMKNYGVEVVEFIPGSFSMNSNIAALQSKHAAEMKESFNEEQLNFYGEYFDKLNSHLSVLSGDKEPQEVINENIVSTFEETLLDAPSKPKYICEPMRYKFYHSLFRVTPVALCDWLVWRFVSFPRFGGSKNNS